MMKYYTTAALIIKGISYGDSSRIFTLFSEAEGKLSAIAKGVKKPKSKLNAVLQLGNKVEVTLARGRNLDTITQAEIIDDYRHIRQNAQAYLHASYIWELLNAATPERQPHLELLRLTEETLRQLATSLPTPLTRYYEIQLLDRLGYRPDFQYCGHCRRRLKEGYLSPLRADITCPACGGGHYLSPRTLYILNYLQGHDLVQAIRLKIDEETLTAMEKALRQLLDYHLERKLRAAAILAENQPSQ